MAAIQGVGYPENGHQLGDLQIAFLLDVFLGCQFIKPGEICDHVAHNVGHQVPLLVRQTDDLRGHDDIIVTLRRLGNGDEFSAVMELHGNIQQQPVSVLEPRRFSHGVKDRQRQIRHMGHMGPVCLVALGNIFCCRQDIIFKIMAAPDDLMLLRIVVCQAVA